MAQVVRLSETNPWFDFPSEEDGHDATVDAFPAFSPDTPLLTFPARREPSASNSPRPVELSCADAGYTQFMRILARAQF
jgi:hypothetical protein